MFGFMAVPEGEVREQEIENLCDTIMMRNFPNLVKKINIQVQEIQTIPNQMNPKDPHIKTHHNCMQKVNDLKGES